MQNDQNTTSGQPAVGITDLLALVRKLEDDRARLRAAIMRAVTVLDTDRDLSDDQIMGCRDDVKQRRLALRHCQSSLR